MQSLLILGRQPLLGLAELESLYGGDKVELVAENVAIVDVDPCLLAFDRLGGSIRFCKLLTKLDNTDWEKIEQFLIDVSPNHSQSMVEGKMRLGISVYGFTITPKRIMASGLSLKRAVQKTGRSVRLIPNKEVTLNSAQIIHNKLTGPNGWELVIIKSGNQTIIAQTVKVQDIEAYAQRDQARPKRDARVGMLPPKLAQVITNLAVGKLPEDKLESICDIPENELIPAPDLGQVILDPFCGSGVIIQESLLMGYKAIAGDIEQRMIDYTKDNVDWLGRKYAFILNKTQYQLGDATISTWPKDFDFVASELFLGAPLSVLPDQQSLNKIAGNCNKIIIKFLVNLSKQTKPGTRICLAIPAWQTKPNQFKSLPLIDQIEELGYNRLSFKHVSSSDLIYYRSNQIVARQLLVITRK
jgi:tRNA G10  N-methylase Trm11